VADSTGAVAAQGSGTGTLVDWTWDATAAPVQKYTWTIVTPGARSATGTIGAGSVAIAVQNAAATPAFLSPGGDPADDTATVAYTLTASATVTATFSDPNGAVLSTLFTTAKPAGAQSFTFTATPGLAPGAYSIQIVASTAAGKTATATVPLVVDDTLDGFVSTPSVFSAAKGATVALTFTLSRLPVSTQFTVLHGTDVVASPPNTIVSTGPQSLTWDGSLDDGTTAPDGDYTLSLAVTDQYTTFTRTATVTLDSTPPKISVLSYRTMKFRLSEPVTLTLVVGTSRYSRTLRKATTTTFWLKQKPRAYQLIASDAAGNVSTVRYRAK
jgi:flagellar hook assembly protein FlgD